MPTDSRPERRRWPLFAAAAAATLVALLWWPVSTKVGVNFVVTELPLPLWLKATDFIDRDRHLARLSEAMVAGIGGEEARTLAVLGWTHRNIRPIPDGFPIVDDHIWHIILRGYGEADQQADVFTTLVAYAGIPAYWGLIGRQPHGMPISFVKIDGRWRVFDAAYGIAYRKRDSTLATAEELAVDPSIIRNAVAGRVENLDQYLAYFEGYRPPLAPDVLRADEQMPIRRLSFEVKKLIGVQGRTWQIWPQLSGS